MSFLIVTLEQVLQLHVLAVLQGGGTEGVRDIGRLESAVATQTQEVFGKELYETVYEKSAALIRGIVGDHPFHDGNKRTAMLVGLTFLEINERQFMASAGELEDFAVQIAVDHLDVAAIAEWLQSHSDKSDR